MKKRVKKKLLLVVYDEKYWKQIINFDALIENGVISENDMKHFTFCNSVDQAFKLIVGHFDRHYLKKEKEEPLEPKLALK